MVAVVPSVLVVAQGPGVADGAAEKSHGVSVGGLGPHFRRRVCLGHFPQPQHQLAESLFAGVSVVFCRRVERQPEVRLVQLPRDPAFGERVAVLRPDIVGDVLLLREVGGHLAQIDQCGVILFQPHVFGRNQLVVEAGIAVAVPQDEFLCRRPAARPHEPQVLPYIGDAGGVHIAEEHSAVVETLPPGDGVGHLEVSRCEKSAVVVLVQVIEVAFGKHHIPVERRVEIDGASILVEALAKQSPPGELPLFLVVVVHHNLLVEIQVGHAFERHPAPLEMRDDT